jgi:hypothetical protein
LSRALGAEKGQENAFSNDGNKDFARLRIAEAAAVAYATGVQCIH